MNSVLKLKNSVIRLEEKRKNIEDILNSLNKRDLNLFSNTCNDVVLLLKETSNMVMGIDANTIHGDEAIKLYKNMVKK